MDPTRLGGRSCLTWLAGRPRTSGRPTSQCLLHIRAAGRGRLGAMAAAERSDHRPDVNSELQVWLLLDARGAPASRTILAGPSARGSPRCPNLLFSFIVHPNDSSWTILAKGPVRSGGGAGRPRPGLCRLPGSQTGPGWEHSGGAVNQGPWTVHHTLLFLPHTLRATDG